MEQAKSKHARKLPPPPPPPERKKKRHGATQRSGFKRALAEAKKRLLSATKQRNEAMELLARLNSEIPLLQSTVMALANQVGERAATPTMVTPQINVPQQQPTSAAAALAASLGTKFQPTMVIPQRFSGAPMPVYVEPDLTGAGSIPANNAPQQEDEPDLEHLAEQAMPEVFGGKGWQ